jgi:hypothetical protein
MIEFDSPSLMSSRFHWPMHGPRRYVELGLRAGAVSARLARDVGGALEILVGGVRAAPDQARREIERIAVLGGVRGHARDGAGEVRRVGADDVGLERREVDLDDLVEVGRGIRLDLRVGPQQLGAGVREGGDLRAPRGGEVGRHALVVREDRRRCAELRPHVGDGALPGAADRPHT